MAVEIRGKDMPIVSDIKTTNADLVYIGDPKRTTTIENAEVDGKVDIKTNGKMILGRLKSSKDFTLGGSFGGLWLFERFVVPILNLGEQSSSDYMNNVQMNTLEQGFENGIGVPQFIQIFSWTGTAIFIEGVQVAKGDYKDMPVFKIPGRPVAIGADAAKREDEWYCAKYKESFAKFAEFSKLRKLDTTFGDMIDLYYSTYPEETKFFDPDHQLSVLAGDWTWITANLRGSDQDAFRAAMPSPDYPRTAALFCVMRAIVMTSTSA